MQKRFHSASSLLYRPLASTCEGCRGKLTTYLEWKNFSKHKPSLPQIKCLTYGLSFIMKSYLVILFWLINPSLFAQQQSKIAGTWEGKINVGVPLRIVFHFKDSLGFLTGTTDSPDQGIKKHSLLKCYGQG